MYCGACGISGCGCEIELVLDLVGHRSILKPVNGVVNGVNLKGVWDGKWPFTIAETVPDPP